MFYPNIIPLFSCLLWDWTRTLLGTAGRRRGLAEISVIGQEVHWLYAFFSEVELTQSTKKMHFYWGGEQVGIRETKIVIEAPSHHVLPSLAPSSYSSWLLVLCFVFEVLGLLFLTLAQSQISLSSSEVSTKLNWVRAVLPVTSLNRLHEIIMSTSLIGCMASSWSTFRVQS